MARYDYHISEGANAPEVIKAEFADDEVAWTEAVLASRAMLHDLLVKTGHETAWKLKVQRDDGRAVCEIEFTARMI